MAQTALVKELVRRDALCKMAASFLRAVLLQLDDLAACAFSCCDYQPMFCLAFLYQTPPHLTVILHAWLLKAALSQLVHKRAEFEEAALCKLHFCRMDRGRLYLAGSRWVPSGHPVGILGG